VTKASPLKRNGIVKVWTENGEAAIAHFNTSTPNIEILAQTGEFTAVDGDLGGQTGTDGDFSIGVDSNGTAIDFENRLNDGARDVHWEFTDWNQGF